eukprot:6801328-Prymnesium_polylepis.1
MQSRRVRAPAALPLGADPASAASTLRLSSSCGKLPPRGKENHCKAVLAPLSPQRSNSEGLRLLGLSQAKNGIDCYAILGLCDGSSEADVRAAHKLAMLNSSRTGDGLREIAIAFEVLGNSCARRASLSTSRRRSGWRCVIPATPDPHCHDLRPPSRPKRLPPPTPEPHHVVCARRRARNGALRRACASQRHLEEVERKRQQHATQQQAFKSMLDSALQQSRQQRSRRAASGALQRATSAPLQRFYVPVGGGGTFYHLFGDCAELRHEAMRTTVTAGRRLCPCCARAAAARPMSLEAPALSCMPCMRSGAAESAATPADARRPLGVLRALTRS